MQTVTIEKLKKVCPVCKHRNKFDNLFFMAWWSHCQTKCKLMNIWRVSKYDENVLEREIERNTKREPTLTEIVAERLGLPIRELPKGWSRVIFKN